MAKRNTVRINMDLLDEYLKAKNIHPKDFCEKQLGFSDGWYYGIRKKGGRGVKVLVAQLIARSIGVEYETLVIDEKNVVKKETINAKIDAGKNTAAGASPRPTEREEGDEKKDPLSDWLESVHESIEADKRKNKAAGLFQKIDALKKDLEEKEKALAVAFEQIETMGRKAEDGIIPVHIDDFIYVLETAITDPTMSRETNYDMLCGYINCFSGLRYLGNKRKGKAKNARPEED